MQSRDSIVMGKVGAAFGVKGWLKVNSFARPAEKLVDYIPWELRDAKRSFGVELVDYKLQAKGLVVRLEGIDDREKAQELRGMEIRVDRSCLPDPDAGHYYWSDLEGLLVRNPAGEEIGRVEQLLSAGAADVMVIVGKQRILVPFIMNETVTRVDLQAGYIELSQDSDD